MSFFTTPSGATVVGEVGTDHKYNYEDIISKWTRSYINNFITYYEVVCVFENFKQQFRFIDASLADTFYNSITGSYFSLPTGCISTQPENIEFNLDSIVEFDKRNFIKDNTYYYTVDCTIANYKQEFLFTGVTYRDVFYKNLNNLLVSIDLISDQSSISQNTFTFQLPIGKTIYVDWGDGSITIVNGNNLSDVSAISTYSTIGIYDIKISGDDLIELTKISIIKNRNISGDVSSWSSLTNLTLLQNYLNNTSGDVSGWSSLTKLTHLQNYLNNTSGDVSGWSSLTKLTTTLQNYSNNTSGDVSGWSALTSLISLFNYSNNTSGDVSGWSSLTSLIFLFNYSNNTSGDVSGWSSLTKLTTLFNYSNNTSGDVSGWSSLTKLTTLFNYSNNTSGDVSGWSSLTKLTHLQNYKNNTSGDVSGWSSLTKLTHLQNYSNNTSFDNITTWDITGRIWMFSNGWDSTMVNNALASFAATPLQNCTINIGGTNAKRTSASDADKAIIINPVNLNVLTVNDY